MKILHTSDWHLGQKTFLLFSFFLFSSSITKGQTHIDFENLYTTCLSSFIDTFSKLDAFKVGDTAFIKKADYLPNYNFDYKGIFIHTISHDSIYKMTKNKKAIRIIDLQALIFKDGIAYINIVNFGVSRRKKHYTLINNGNQNHKIGYDCINNKFIHEVESSH